MKKNNRNYTKSTAVFLVCMALLTSCGAPKFEMASVMAYTNSTNSRGIQADYKSKTEGAAYEAGYSDEEYASETADDAGTVYG
ncbi:MAG: hypothetical protein J6P89_10250, partial [Oscillospiraceae bacterium]|nr:hypothetical protein [Oscillospiraceae bacterium]